LRKIISISLSIILSLLCLCSCSGGKTEDIAEKVKEEFSLIQSLDLTANVSADYGDKVFEYKLKFVGDLQSGTVKVLKPENIAGLTAEVSILSETVKLIYDGAELDTGNFENLKISPVSALPNMLALWQNGYVSECILETVNGEECIMISYQPEDGISLKTWFDAATLLPYKAEFSENGYTRIYCEFENIILE